MSEQLRFHTIDDLEALSLTELQALWDLVPTDRQKAYRAAYDREIRQAGAVGSDMLERQVAAALLLRYQESALVPVGSRWARTPQRVQDAARDNETLEDTADKPAARSRSTMMLAGGLALALLVGWLLLRLMSGDGSSDLDPEMTAEPSATPTPEISPTPTPLALEAQDDVIADGDDARAAAYPVNLQVMTGEDAPRVWVVQRRAVRTAEWRFDPNPDIASFVNGMSVRPVIGIPWSADNAALFNEMGMGTVFTLTLNTGAILRYEFADKTEVLRSDTRIFRQVGPGLVLLLIGETDADGLPTATRTLVTASYPPEQELARLDELVSLQVIPTPDDDSAAPPTPTSPPSGLDVQVISMTTLDGQITTRLRIYNRQATPVTFTPDDIWLALGYSEDPPGPRNPAEGLQPFTLLPEQAADLTLIWPWQGEPFGALQVGDWRFAMRVMRQS